MRSFLQGLITATLIASAAGAAAQTAPAASTAPKTAEEWRQQYERDLRAEYGWLSVAGLTFLPEGTHTVGSDPASAVVLPAGHAPQHVGRIVVADEGVTLHLEPGIEALLNGKPSPSVVSLKKAERAAPGHAGLSGRSNPRRACGVPPARERRPARAARARSRVAHSRRLPGAAVVPGVGERAGRGHVEALRGAEGRGRQEHPRRQRAVLHRRASSSSPGRDEAAHARVHVHQGTAAADLPRCELWDERRTAPATSYAEPTGDGRYVIDFNKAYNPPCAYNPYTTCPTPPSQNILKVPIRAGEKIYDGPASSAHR